MSALNSTESIVWTLLPIMLLCMGSYWLVRSLFTLRRRPMRSCMGACGGLAAVMSAMACYLLAFNLFSYERLTAEQDIATISFRELEPNLYAVRLAVRGEAPQQYRLYGDEWQMDARVIKWKSWALYFGLDTYYRLERLSGRYRDLERELNAQRSVISLSQEDSWQEWDATVWEWDFWSLARKHPQWLPLVDASYGSATYLPMVDGRAYVVSVTSSGLIARPVQGIL